MSLAEPIRISGNTNTGKLNAVELVAELAAKYRLSSVSPLLDACRSLLRSDEMSIAVVLRGAEAGRAVSKSVAASFWRESLNVTLCYFAGTGSSSQPPRRNVNFALESS